MKDNEQKILYLCDGKKDCSKRDCERRIGDCQRACKYTTDINHAKNFYKVPLTESKVHFFEEDNDISKQILEHLAEIRKELQVIQGSMGPATVNICNTGVPVDELSQQIKSALEKQSLENPNDILLGLPKEQMERCNSNKIK